MAAPKEKTNIVTLIVYDFETGGLDCNRCAATQISLHFVRLDTFEVMEKYNAYIYPYNKKADMSKPKKKTLKSKYDVEEEELMDYENRALEVSGITMDMLYSMGKPLEDVCAEICDAIERNTFPVSSANKPVLVGQNPLFDSGFMQQIMVYSGMWARFCKLVRGSKDFFGNFQPVQLDTITLAQMTFGNDKSVMTWKLEMSAEKLNIELDDAHDADADVTATREIVRVLTARMRNSDGNSNAVGSLAVEKREKLRDHFKI